MRSHSTALVLEDNPHMRYTLSQLLQALKIEQVDAVATITDATEHLSFLHYDFALIDVGLDGENGLDLIRAVRRDPAHPARRTPIIVVSGQSQLNVVSQARDAGADAFLAKPISQASLTERVKQILERPRPYVESEAYFGPDRRRRQDPAYCGPERRQQSVNDDYYV